MDLLLCLDVTDIVVFLYLIQIQIQLKECDFLQSLSQSVVHSVSANLIGHLNVGEHLQELIDGKNVFPLQKEFEKLGQLSS